MGIIFPQHSQLAPAWIPLLLSSKLRRSCVSVECDRDALVFVQIGIGIIRTSPPRRQPPPPLPGVSQILPGKSKSVSVLAVLSGRLFLTHLCGIQNSLYLLQQAAFILLKARVCFHRLLDQELDVPQLAEVEVPFPFQALHRLHELCILLLKDRTRAYRACLSRAGSRGCCAGRRPPRRCDPWTPYTATWRETRGGPRAYAFPPR